jgi:hypothetical protein
MCKNDIVGVTDPMDPSKHPSLTGKFSEFQTILAKDANCSVSPTRNLRMHDKFLHFFLFLVQR